MSDTTKNGMDYGLSRDRFDTEEEFEEALALAESLAENGHWYGIVPEDFASFDQYRERFLPLEEMWNHLAGLFYVYPKDFGSFGEFVKAFFEAGADRMDAVARYLGLPEDSVSSAETFLAACGEMPTEQIRQFIREKAETDEEAILRTIGEIFGLDRSGYEYQRFYMADLARASLRAEDLGVHYGVKKADHPDRIDFMMALYQAKKKWDAQGEKYGLDPMQFEAFPQFLAAYQNAVKESMMETARQQGIDIDPGLPYGEYAEQWARKMREKGLLE